MRIKNIFPMGSTAFAIIALLLLAGCSTKDPKTPELELPVMEKQDLPATEAEIPEVVEAKAPSLAGKNWSGYYYRTDKPGRLALTATVKQKKGEIKLTTYSGKEKVHSLIGNVANDGQLNLEDKLLPSIWTSSYGAATDKSLKIVASIGDENDPASQIITLRR